MSFPWKVDIWSQEILGENAKGAKIILMYYLLLLFIQLTNVSPFWTANFAEFLFVILDWFLFAIK